MDNIVVIKEEIDLKGKCYIMCNDLENKSEKHVFNNILNDVYESNNISYFLSCKDVDFDTQQEEIDLDKFRLVYYTDMIQMKKTLVEIKSELLLQSLKNEKIKEYTTEHNTSFFDVPCSATYSVDMMKEKIDNELIDVGLIYENASCVGTYEINYGNNEAEIDGLSINVDKQNKGYGKKALDALEGYLYQKGYNEVKLTVASINTKAYELYEENGYEYDLKRSRWYRVEKN